MSILTLPPTGELIAEYNRRIQQLGREAYEDVERRREEFRQFERDRFRRYEDEARGLIRMRDALANIQMACEGPKSPIVVVETHERLQHQQHDCLRH